MCGIAGIVSLDGRPVHEAELRRMCGAMVHRGPDGEGLFVDGQVGLGMRRLSIIDLEGGQQPAFNEDGSVVVVFNGEIYNYRALARELAARGHAFRTASDTEVIVHQYEEDGVDCVEALRGMFAFAAWDARSRRLVVARDRLGIKPLYYVEAGGRLAFASELKVLLELPEVARQIDWQAASHYLAFLTTPESRSIVAGVKKLPPAHRLVVSGGVVRVERYWDVAFRPQVGRTADSFVEELRALLDEAVRLHMVSDVPVGAFLSGGIDSAAVVAHMTRHATAPVMTFSIGFAEAGFDELAEARRIARAFGTEHHEAVVRPNVLAILDDLAYWLDEPFGDSSAIPTFMVSELAARHVKVVLSGDGGDELFAGYDRYVVEARERVWRLLPWPMRSALGSLAGALPEGVRGRRYLRHVCLPDSARYLDAVTLFPKAAQRRLLRPEAYAAIGDYDPSDDLASVLAATPVHWLSSLQAADLRRYLPLDILTKVDRMSMAHSLETRPPLLDHRLVEFAATIPAEVQFHQGVTKSVFRRALEGVLPEETLHRPKRGFAIPLGAWFRGEVGSYVADLLLSPSSHVASFFEPRELRRLVTARDARESLALDLWSLVSLELWCRTFLRGSVRRPEPTVGRLATAEAGGAP